MELTQLNYFMEVAATQHITKSAERLHIAQPALTQAMRRLENEIGVKLFERRGRGIVLTEYGRYLYEALSPALDRLEQIPAELRRMAQIDRETLRINVLAASALVTEAIVEYKKKSEVNFSVFQSDVDAYDIEVTTRLSHSVGHERQKNETVLEEEIFLAVPKEKYADVISLSELRDEGFICLAGSRQFRAICDKYCHRIGFKPNIIFESDNPTAVRNAIAAGLGVGFWPQFTWDEARNEHIRLIGISDIGFRRDIVISYNAARADNKNLRDFYTFLTGFFAKRKKES